MGVNGTARAAGTSKNTVMNLAADVGQACVLYQDRVMNELHSERSECDETGSWAVGGSLRGQLSPV